MKYSHLSSDSKDKPIQPSEFKKYLFGLAHPADFNKNKFTFLLFFVLLFFGICLGWYSFSDSHTVTTLRQQGTQLQIGIDGFKTQLLKLKKAHEVEKQSITRTLQAKHADERREATRLSKGKQSEFQNLNGQLKMVENERDGLLTKTKNLDIEVETLKKKLQIQQHTIDSQTVAMKTLQESVEKAEKIAEEFQENEIEEEEEEEEYSREDFDRETILTEDEKQPENKIVQKDVDAHRAKMGEPVNNMPMLNPAVVNRGFDNDAQSNLLELKPSDPKYPVSVGEKESLVPPNAPEVNPQSKHREPPLKVNNLPPNDSSGCNIVTDHSGKLMVCPTFFDAHHTEHGVCVAELAHNLCIGTDWNDPEDRCDPRFYVLPNGRKWPNSEWQLPKPGIYPAAGSTVLFEDDLWATNGVPVETCEEKYASPDEKEEEEIDHPLAHFHNVQGKGNSANDNAKVGLLGEGLHGDTRNDLGPLGQIEGKSPLKAGISPGDTLEMKAEGHKSGTGIPEPNALKKTAESGTEEREAEAQSQLQSGSEGELGVDGENDTEVQSGAGEVGASKRALAETEKTERLFKSKGKKVKKKQPEQAGREMDHPLSQKVVAEGNVQKAGLNEKTTKKKKKRKKRKRKKKLNKEKLTRLLDNEFDKK